MLLQEKEDSDTDTDQSLKLAPSTKINVYVNPYEKANDGWRQEEEKGATKDKEAPVKQSVFKAYKNYSS